MIVTLQFKKHTFSSICKFTIHDEHFNLDEVDIMIVNNVHIVSVMCTS